MGQHQQTSVMSTWVSAQVGYARADVAAENIADLLALLFFIFWYKNCYQ